MRSSCRTTVCMLLELFCFPASLGSNESAGRTLARLEPRARGFPMQALQEMTAKVQQLEACVGQQLLHAKLRAKT